MALPSTLPYDRVMVNMEREEVSLGRTKSQLDPRLISTTTGSVENSCHSCLLPFGVLASIIGLVTTSVACAGRFSDTILIVAGGVLLATGLLGVTVSCIWQQYRRRKHCGSWTILTDQTKATVKSGGQKKKESKGVQEKIWKSKDLFCRSIKQRKVEDHQSQLHLATILLNTHLRLLNEDYL